MNCSAYEVSEVCINTNHMNSPSSDDHEGIYSLLQAPHDVIDEVLIVAISSIVRGFINTQSLSSNP